MAHVPLIRKLAAFLVLSAIATAALAGSIRDREREVMETAYAADRGDSASDDTIKSVRDSAGVGAPGGDEDSGNPLWAVPLSRLTETLERPLFSSSRRPPPPSAPQAAVPAPVAENPAPVTPSAPEPPHFALIGTIVSSAASIAVVRNDDTQAVARVRAGDEDSGWRVRSVAPRSIIVEKGAESVVVRLPKSLDKTEAQPAPEPQQAEEKSHRH